MLNGSAYETQNLHKRIAGRHGAYVDRRQLCDAQRDVIAELLRPDLVPGSAGDLTEGAFEGSGIVEGTGPHAVLVWQRGFMANMISRKDPWFKEALREPPVWSGVRFKGNDQINQYCQDLADHMTNVYRRSNYYDVMGEFVLNAGTVGSPVMLFEQDIVNDRVICKVPHYGNVWLDRDVFGYDNAVHVLWEWTALQAAEFFGRDQLTAAVKNQLDTGNHYSKTKYLQVIYGAGDPIYKGLNVAQNRPWLEHFICLAPAGELEEHVLKPLHKGPGYFTRPFSTWHYHRNDHEVYSRTMAWWAIFDIRGLNSLWEALFGEAESSVRPPTWAMESMRGMLDLSPGGDNWARNAQEAEHPPVFLERKTRPNVTSDFTDRLAATVQRHFHYSYFMPVNQVVENKTQPESVFALMKTAVENMGQLAPEVETFENQALGNSHDILLDMERMKEPAYPWGALPVPPPIAQDFSDGTIVPEFIGLLSIAQRQNRELMKALQGLSTIQVFAELDPNIIHKIRRSVWMERLLEAEDVPQDIIVPEEEYQGVVDAINQRAMQRELMENAPKMAKAVQNLQGGTAKDSPLAALTGATA